jgi:hypothetical protein
MLSDLFPVNIACFQAIFIGIPRGKNPDMKFIAKKTNCGQ